MTVSVLVERNALVERPVKAPASSRELRTLLVISLIGLLTSASVAVFAIIELTSWYLLAVSVIPLILATGSLGLFVRSYFRSVEFVATAEGMLVEVQVMQERINDVPPELAVEFFGNSTNAFLATARRYGDGLTASGHHDLGALLIERVASLGSIRTLVEAQHSQRLARRSASSRPEASRQVEE